MVTAATIADNFDSHCEERYACDPKSPPCTDYKKPYVAVQCGCHVPNPGVYQMPVSLLLPKRAEAANLLVPVCASASHVAYATVRMEPQFMMLGHAAGVVAALSAKHEAAVQDVDLAEMHALLVADGAHLNGTETPKPKKMGFRCGADTCFPSPRHTYHNSSCDGAHAIPLCLHAYCVLRAACCAVLAACVCCEPTSLRAVAASCVWRRCLSLCTSRCLMPACAMLLFHRPLPRHHAQPVAAAEGSLEGRARPPECDRDGPAGDGPEEERADLG